MKIGERFIEQGLLTAAQLEEALRAQLIFGGHLGTCLLELGYVEEAVLGRTLASIYGVGYAPPHFFDNVARTVVQAMPRRVVEKHSVVPFDLKDRTLHVAMIDPKNLPAIDEIAFATGQKVAAWVAPEARIFQVMERYYDVPRRQRYVSVCQDLDRGGGAQAGGGADRSSAGPSRFERVYEQPPYLSALTDGTRREETSVPVSGSRHDDLADRLCAADVPSEVADAVLDFATRTLPRCALFMVSGATATLWRSRGLSGSSIAPVIALPVTSEPLFELLHERDHYRGGFPATPGHRRLFDALGVPVPIELILVPGYLEDRLVVIFYGDAGPGGLLRKDLDDPRDLVAKAVAALQIVAIKKKIRASRPADAAAEPAGAGRGAQAA